MKGPEGMDLLVEENPALTRPILDQVRASLVRQPWMLSCAIAGVTCALTAAMMASIIGWQAEPQFLLMDPNALASQPPYYGAIGVCGAAIWLAAGACALMASLAAASRDAPVRQALLFGGALTVIMALDDLLMLHEGILPLLGVPEGSVLFVYAGLGALFLWRVAAFALSTDWLLLLAGQAGLGGSMVADMFMSRELISTWAVQVVFEDVVLKLTGILFWSAFLVRLALASLAADRRRLPSER